MNLKKWVCGCIVLLCVSHVTDSQAKSKHTETEKNIKVLSMATTEGPVAYDDPYAIVIRGGKVKTVLIRNAKEKGDINPFKPMCVSVTKGTKLATSIYNCPSKSKKANTK